MKYITINAEDWYNGNVLAEDKDWDRFEYRVDKLLVPMLDELDRHKVKAVVFCTGWLGEKHPEIVQEIARRGHKIGCNGYWHEEPNTLTKEQFREDLMKTKGILEKVCGQRVDCYRAPNFAIDGIEDWFFEVLKDCKIQFDFSTFGDKVCSKGDVIEYPVAKYKGKIPFSGGGYFRLMPYWLIRKAMKEMDYVITYFHPRDFDKEQPKWPGLGMKDKFLSYVGVSGGFKKFQRMLNEFKFDNI